jgi:iron only hydrogenase large subunit-like protein
VQDDEVAEAPKVAKVTLNDCLACAGCVTSAETVLVTQQSIEEFERMLHAGPAAYDLFVVSVSPAARAAIAVHSGLSLCDTHSHLTGFLKTIGCHQVIDCGVGADLSLMQAAAEFVHRFQAAGAAAAGAPPSSDAVPLPLPLLTSSCPGWVCYAEKMLGDHFLPYLSRVKSPQQITGTLVKYGHAAARGIKPERVCHVSVMPCFDKKLEAARDDFFNPSAGPSGTRDVDCVLSSGEVLQLLEQRGCATLAAAPECQPDTEPPYSALLPGSDGGTRGFRYASPGASGGCADYVFRHAAKELFGVDIPPGPLPWVATRNGRNPDLQELSLEQGGRAVLTFARCYGFKNIQNVIRRVKSGTTKYHFVEVMACPGGCANGGGQPRPPPLEAPTRAAAVEAQLVSTEETAMCSPLTHPCVQALYAQGGFLAGGPLGEAAQRHLLTQFHAIDPSKQNPLTISW